MNADRSHHIDDQMAERWDGRCRIDTKGEWYKQIRNISSIFEEREDFKQGMSIEDSDSDRL